MRQPVYCEITTWETAVKVMVVMRRNGMLETYGNCTITLTGQPGELTPLEVEQPEPVPGHVTIAVIELGFIPGGLRLWT